MSMTAAVVQWTPYAMAFGPPLRRTIVPSAIGIRAMASISRPSSRGAPLMRRIAIAIAMSRLALTASQADPWPGVAVVPVGQNDVRDPHAPRGDVLHFGQRPQMGVLVPDDARVHKDESGGLPDRVDRDDGRAQAVQPQPVDDRSVLTSARVKPGVIRCLLSVRGASARLSRRSSHVRRAFRSAQASLGAGSARRDRERFRAVASDRMAVVGLTHTARSRPR